MRSTGWEPVLNAMLDAAWIVDPTTLRIADVNPLAALLVGMDDQDLIGKPVIELTATPEDMFFWEDVAAGLADSIHSNTMLRCSDGIAVPVERRVSRVRLSADQPMFLVTARDLRPQHLVANELEDRLAELRATLESTGDGILVTDLMGTVRNYNRHFAELWAVPEAILESRDDQALYAHMASRVVDPVDFQARLNELTQNPLQEATDVLMLSSGGLVERMTLPQYSRGRAMGRVYSFRDITRKVETESRLQLAAKVFEFSLDAIFITDAQFELLQINPRCEHLTGCSRAQLVGTSARKLFHDPQQPDYFNQVELGLSLNGLWSGEVWRMAGGRPCAVEVSWVALRNDRGEVQHTVGFFQDLTERLEAQKRIETLAYTDVLTGLPNRLLLTQRVDLALRMVHRHGGSCAVLFIDMDHFKNINDSLGHAFGDRVLIEVADRVKRCLRDVDTLCRLGADEFVGFLQDADAFGAEIAARRILESLAQPFLVGAINFSLGCSIGVAMYPEDGRTVDALIQCADTAMHRVKERGRGNFRFYQPQMNVDLLSRMKMDHAMRQAMEQGLFRLVYQPQVSLRDGRLLGAEALVRWTDAELGAVPPATFIPLAEESGFIIAIGNWVMGEAVRQATLWQNLGRPVVISVNVSALQFQQPDFVERVADSLRSVGLAPALLELELTESILIKDANEALSRLHALAALGISLAIDDFGTGYSSLAYLKKFPISKLKIDRAFVMGLPEDESDRAIVSATVAMARALKLEVVAEGVETTAQRDYLRSLECESFQGYLCSPGLPAAEFEQLIAGLPAGARQEAGAG
jgi:diguanylate cyclase (GGDEF)-like protein/PAS domain S-box-containing protein